MSQIGKFQRTWDDGDSGRNVTLEELRAEHLSFIDGYDEFHGAAESEVPTFGAWLECELQDQLTYQGDEDALVELINTGTATGLGLPR